MRMEQVSETMPGRFAKSDDTKRAERNAKRRDQRSAERDAEKSKNDKLLDKYWRVFTDTVSQTYPDGDPIDMLASKYRDFDMDKLEAAARKNGYDHPMDYWDEMGDLPMEGKKKSPAGGPACWKGKKIHPTKPTKMKGGKRVNNCIDAGTSESFDPSAEPTQQDELMDIYLQRGEEGLADALGLTPEQLDQEINEIGFEHGLHADDDREEIIYKVIDDTISNADIDAYEETAVYEMEQLRKLAGLPEPEMLHEDIQAANFLMEMTDDDFEMFCESLSIEELELLEAGWADRLKGIGGKVAGMAKKAGQAIAPVAKTVGQKAAAGAKAAGQAAVAGARSAGAAIGQATGDAVDQAMDPVRGWRADRAEKKLAKLQKVKQTKQRLAKAQQSVKDFDRELPGQAPAQAAPAEVPAEPAPTVATAPKTKAKSARQLSMTPNAIRKREQRAKAKAAAQGQPVAASKYAKMNESYPMGMDPDNNTNVSFNQTKKIGDATLNIHATAKDMAELQKVLQMAGLDPEGAEKHMPEPDSVKVVDVEPMPSPCGGDARYSTDKTELIDMLRNKLANKLN